MLININVDHSVWPPQVRIWMLLSREAWSRLQEVLGNRKALSSCHKCEAMCEHLGQRPVPKTMF